MLMIHTYGTHVHVQAKSAGGAKKAKQDHDGDTAEEGVVKVRGTVRG